MALRRWTASQSWDSPSRRIRTSNESTSGQPHLLFVVNVDSFFLSHRLPIALAARDKGYAVTIAAADTGHSDRIRAHGLAFEPLPVDRRSENPLKELRLLTSLFLLYRRLKPDIIHHVTIKPIVYGTLVSLALPRSAVVNAISGLGYMMESAGELKRRLMLATYRILSFRPQLHFIVQNREHQELLQAIGVPNSKLVLIEGSGVDPAVFEPPPVEPEPAVVMLPARLLIDKGVREFAAAARRLGEDYSQVRFVLVGPADDDNPSAVSRSLVQSWVDEGAVEWWGHRVDMAKMLQQASIVVLPSHHEGFPKVLLEAAATARPMIASDIAGCRPIVTDDTGIRVPVGDVEQLAGAIRRLLDDPGSRQRLGSAARRRVLSRFTIQHVTDLTMSVYASLLKREESRLRKEVQT